MTRTQVLSRLSIHPCTWSITLYLRFELNDRSAIFIYPNPHSVVKLAFISGSLIKERYSKLFQMLSCGSRHNLVIADLRSPATVLRPEVGCSTDRLFVMNSNRHPCLNKLHMIVYNLGSEYSSRACRSEKHDENYFIHQVSVSEINTHLRSLIGDWEGVLAVVIERMIFDFRSQLMVHEGAYMRLRGGIQFCVSSLCF